MKSMKICRICGKESKRVLCDACRSPDSERCLRCGESFISKYKTCDSCREKNKEKCKKQYIKNKERYIKRTREYEKDNRDKVIRWRRKALDKFRKVKRKRWNELIMKNYEKNKNKWSSRKKSRELIKQGRLKINFTCKSCGTNVGLEIHHETYPTKIGEIIKAFSEGKIYYLCKKCHRNINE